MATAALTPLGAGLFPEKPGSPVAFPSAAVRALCAYKSKCCWRLSSKPSQAQVPLSQYRFSSKYRAACLRRMPHLMPLNCGQCRDYFCKPNMTPQRPDWLAVDAVRIEPVSTGQIPVYQGKELGIL
jgi:hypothetical protein